MFFTRLAMIVAWLAFLFGGLRFALALYIALGEEPASRTELTLRYLGSGPVGRHIDRGLYVMVFGIILGAVMEHIQRSIPKPRNDA